MDGSIGRIPPRKLLPWLVCVPPPGPWFFRLQEFCRFFDPLPCDAPFLPQLNRCQKNSSLWKRNNCMNRGSRDRDRQTKTVSIYSCYFFSLLRVCCLSFLPGITNSPTLITSLEPCKRRVTASVLAIGLPKSVVISICTVVAPAMTC